MALSNDRNVGTRAPLDPSLRRRIYGPVQPMDRPRALPGILQRLLGHH